MRKAKGQTLYISGHWLFLEEYSCFWIVELVGIVQSGTVKFDVIMDMFSFDMGGYDKLMFTIGKF